MNCDHCAKKFSRRVRMSTSFPPIINMFCTGRFRRAICVCLLLLSLASPLLRQSGSDGTLYRVFLRDGSALLSCGEFARVSDRIVLSVPLGGTAASPDLHLLSFPADSVDWEK